MTHGPFSPPAAQATAPAPAPPRAGRAPERLAALVEALAPVAVSQTYIWLVPRDRPRWMDVVCGLAVATIAIVVVARHGPRTMRGFGLGPMRDHLRAGLSLALFTLAASAALLAWGWWAERLRLEGDAWRALLGYPWWGFAQQALMLGVIYPRLRVVCGLPPCAAAIPRQRTSRRGDSASSPAVPAELTQAPHPAGRVRAGLPPLLMALVFAGAHAPNALLMLGGGVMALTFARVWDRAPSLPLSGLCHGLVGAVCDKLLHVSMRVGAHYLTPGE